MRKTRFFPMAVVILSTLAFAGVSWARGPQEGKVHIKLSAYESVKTPARGEATLWLGNGGESIHYVIRVKDLENVTMGHIHAVNPDGARGEILAWLYYPPTPAESPVVRDFKTTGTLVEGDISYVKNGTPRELFEQIKAGKAGVALHTKRNPAGELWGVYKVKGHKMEPMKGHGKRTMKEEKKM